MAGARAGQGAEDRAAAPDLHGRARPRLRADLAALSGWTLTLRRRGRTDRTRHASLREALSAMEAGLDVLAGGTSRRDERFLGREFPAAALVEARAELRGPRGARGGVDLHADRSTQPWTGRLRRRAVEPDAGETSYDALERVLGGAPGAGG